MSQVASVFYVEVEGIIVADDVLGKQLTLKSDHMRTRMDFPDQPDSFQFIYGSALSAGGTAVDSTGYEHKDAFTRSGGGLVEIRLLQVVVNTEAPFDIQSWDPEVDSDSKAYGVTIHSMMDEGLRAVTELLQRLQIDLNQDWIQPSGTYPRIVNLANLIDIATGVNFRVSIGPVGAFRVVAPESILTSSDLEAIQQRMASGVTERDELFLAEAAYLIQSDQTAAPDRATLMAAIGVELRTKRLLRRLAGTEGQPMLDLLIDNPADWSMAAHGLFKKSIPILFGAPLGDEHRHLSRQVQTLLEDRNRIVHRGATIDRLKARSHVETARAAFRMMAAIQEQFDARP